MLGRMPPGWEHAATLIGRLVLQWAGVERSLGYVVHYLYHTMGGDAIEAEFPRALNRRIQFVRACANKMAWEKRLSDKACELMDETARLGDERHWCIHGFAHNTLDRSTDDVIRFIRPKLKEPRTYEERVYTPEQVDEIGLDCLALDANLIFFVGFWLGAVPPDERDEFLRKIRIQYP